MFIGVSKDRALHSLSVAQKMKELAQEQCPGDIEFAQDMFSLGIVHDIGYEYAAIQTEHAEVGGNILKRVGYKYWQEVFSHGYSDATYDSLALRILNTADLSTDAKGNRVTVQERLDDVKARYGEDSFQYLDFLKLAQKLNLV